MKKYKIKYKKDRWVMYTKGKKDKRELIMTFNDWKELLCCLNAFLEYDEIMKVK